MHCSPVSQVSPQSNSESLNSLPLFSNGVEVAQGLGGMFMAPVAGIYHGDASIVGNHPGCSFPGMPDNNYISTAPDHFRHISNHFAFGQGACPYVHCSYDTTP